MGHEIITVLIGSAKFPISVHKNLMFATSALFKDLEANLRHVNRQIEFAHEEPSMFKLFVEYLYAKKIPQVQESSTPLEKALRIKDLCQFHTFADKWELKTEVRDNITTAGMKR